MRCLLRDSTRLLPFTFLQVNGNAKGQEQTGKEKEQGVRGRRDERCCKLQQQLHQWS